MSDIPEAVGSVAQGAALARAVEPRHGEAGGATLDHGHFAESACLNCGAALAGPYCAQCGQAAHLHRTFGAFLHDLAHGVLHLEGKTWRTLPLLAVQPGRLTRDYIDGRRARYVSPMALFLFSVFLMFAAFQVMGISPPAQIETRQTLDRQGKAAVAALEEERTGLQQELAGMAKGDPARARAGRRIAEIGREIEDAGELEARLDGGVDLRVDAAHTGNARLDHGIEKWRTNPGLMLYKLQSNSYKFSWLLIPLSLPFVWLIFAWRRRFGLYDHAVFVTYSIAFMTLLFLLLAIGGALGVPTAALAVAGTVVPLVHLYRHVRGAYELSAFSAAWRTIALVALIGLVVALFAALLLMLGTLG